MKRVLAPAIAGILLAACSSSTSRVAVVESADAPVATSEAPEDSLPDPGGFTNGDFPFDPAKQYRAYDRFLVDAVSSIDEFWTRRYSDVYDGDYAPLAGGVHPVYPGRTTSIPTGCSFAGDYADVEDNAFYCDENDFIVYDDESLFPSYVDAFGVAVVGVILAHEWGHAIQSPARHGVFYDLASPTLELQADCFAGAWMSDAVENGVGDQQLSEADVTGALLGLVQLGDLPGDLATDEAAHGSAFDRVSAFQDGYSGGLSPCVDYETNQPQPLQFGFSEEELARDNPSDLPFDQEMFDELSGDLGKFWDALLASDTPEWRTPKLVVTDTTARTPRCGDRDATVAIDGVYVCSLDSTVTIDGVIALDAYEQIPGDFAVGYLIAVGYAELVQEVVGTDLSGKDRHLLNDCLAGMWAADILPFNENPVAPSTDADPRLGLSPGDLDEAIRMAIQLGDTSDDDRQLGTSFEKVDAFRQGVLYGSDGCFGSE